jgi:hypothetical protein
LLDPGYLPPKAGVLEKNTVRLIAFYLPQYHPIQENDEWWGKGFTEWTNVTKAKPLFKGHYQPHLPADLGFYDLRVPEIREAQAEMAKQCGIEGFCYYHYWFGNGKRLLERPFNEVIQSGKPTFPFCLCWANDSWTGIWHGAPNRTLIEQEYPGKEDYVAHFYTVLEAFHDPRYMTVNGKNIFMIYYPRAFADVLYFTEIWRKLAEKEGLRGIHFIAHATQDDPEKYGCDACIDNAPFVSMAWTYSPFFDKVLSKIKKTFLKRNIKPTLRSYDAFVEYLRNKTLSATEYPLVVPNWDNTPRSGSNGWVLYNSTPVLFKQMLQNALNMVLNEPSADNRIVFIKAWNEWAEGNYLEPDRKFGHQYLQVIKECLEGF